MASKMAYINEKLKNFNFKNLDINQLEKDFMSADKMPVIFLKLNKGRAIYRCRKNSPPSDLYYFEKDISFRTDLKNINSFGRVNFPQSSKFYGSISKPVKDENIDGYLISVAETSKLFREDLDGFERFTIGMWEFKEDMEAMIIVPDFENQEAIKKNEELIQKFNQFKNSLNLDDEQIEFIRLIGKEFSKKANINNEYAISALFGEMMLEKKEINAIAYPSVQAGYSGINVVLNPDTANSNLVLKKVLVADLFKFKKEIFFNHVYFSELENGSPFKWEDIKEPTYTNLNTIIDFFEKQGIDKNYIIHKLLDQLNKS
ncbi:MAG: hypothetical protein RLZZ414_97 [Bacteroidota bacterium]|jgi:hypothetical protein